MGHYSKKIYGDFSSLDCNKGKTRNSLVCERPYSLVVVQLLTVEQNKNKHSKNDLRPGSENKKLQKFEIAGEFGETTSSNMFSKTTILDFK